MEAELEHQVSGFNILSAINAERSRVVSLFREVYALIPNAGVAISS